MKRQEDEMRKRMVTGWILHAAMAVATVAALAQQERDKAIQEANVKAAQENAGKIWTDPETRLMWTKKDNGSDVNWQKAKMYCRNLRLAGYSDWRLPAIDELSDIYDPKANIAGQMGSGSQATWHVKGNLQLSGWQWSNTQGNASWQAWLFLFANGERYSSPLTGSGLDRVLCVRPAENKANSIGPYFFFRNFCIPERVYTVFRGTYCWLNPEGGDDCKKPGKHGVGGGGVGAGRGDDLRTTAGATSGTTAG